MANQTVKMVLDTSQLDKILCLPSGPLDKYRAKASFDWKKMKLLIEGETAIKLQQKIWSTMEADPIFNQTPWTERSRHEERKITFLRLKKVIEYGFISEEDVINDPFLMPAFVAALIQYDTSLCGKKVMSQDNFIQGLQISGSSFHRQLIKEIESFNALGALTITEMSHGSNIRAIRTRATYDPKAKQFILHTPDIEATKVYSGILGQTATHAIVYAQLVTPDGVSHGPHSFCVPIRDPKTLLPYPGLRVGDMGPKVGMDGMDNGWIIFNQYRIARDSMMNKHADLTDDGRYILKTKDSKKRFGSSLGILSLGRIFMTYTCTLNLQQAITIAIRYAAVRKQFGPPNSSESELEIIEYPIHQWRLFPYLAACYVYRIFFNSFYEDFINLYAATTYGLSSDLDLFASSSEIHALSCASKAVTSWVGRDGIQESREACGGHGYLKASKLNQLRVDHDANNTHEGDCNVILQQTSNYLLRLYNQKLNSSTKITSPSRSIDFIDNIEQILSNSSPPNDLTSLDKIISVYHFLICYLLETSKKRIDKNILSRGGKVDDPNDDDLWFAKSNCQVYLRNLSISYFECNSLERYNQFISQDCLPDELSSILMRLGLIYGIWSLEKHWANLFISGYFKSDSSFVDSSRLLLQELCSSIKDDSVSLVDTFAPTDFVLNSVLGYSDGDIYKHIFDAITKADKSEERPEWYQEFTVRKPKTPMKSNL